MVALFIVNQGMGTLSKRVNITQLNDTAGLVRTFSKTFVLCLDQSQKDRAIELRLFF